MGTLSSTSLDRLATCHANLQIIVNAVATVPGLDFSVICGHRTAADQAAALLAHTSTVLHSKHEETPALAVDLWPYVVPFGAISGDRTQVAAIAKQTGKSEAQVAGWVREQFCVLAGAMMMAARTRGIRLRCGRDWNSDGDGNLFDNVSLDDLPHFELM